MFVRESGPGWAVLAAGALVASLLAVGASPVGAQDTRLADTPDEATKLSACVGDAEGDQGFTDVSDDHAFKDAVNCIAYYGITNGTPDRSTYSPNKEVTRAQMAVLIARAAGVAGVDLDDPMGDKFDDISDNWARDEINQLADAGMISSGGDFRPGDAITRAEMAHFLVGLLVKASPIVKKNSDGDILLGSGQGREADDWFADARASVPAGNDAEISALYELGVTKGASAAAVQDETKRPLDVNYEPEGKVNRGQMAAFITRALAHTSARPEGVSAQFDGAADVVVSVRDDKFQPRANVTVDVFLIKTADIDVAFRRDGSCDEVSKVSGTGQHLCEIDGTDLLTGGDGDASVALGQTVDKGGTTVWAWTGDNEDTVDDDTDLYRLNIPEDAVTKTADRVRISTEYPDNKKVHLGSSVVYTVQLENADGPVTVGTDSKKPRPAKFLVEISVSGYTSGGVVQGTTSVSTMSLTTDADGKATFSVEAGPDLAPTTKGDKYSADIRIRPAHNGNAPGSATDTAGGTSAAAYFVGAKATAAVGDSGVRNFYVDVRVDDATTANRDEGLVFSTEPSDRTVITAGASLPSGLTTTEGPGVTVSVEPGAGYVASDGRGAGNRATVTVTDQYGDPIPGARVSLTSTGAPNALSPTEVVIGGKRFLAVSRDGSYTFGYTRANDAPAAEMLTPRWDHDGDGCTATLIADSDHRCSNDPDGDGPLTEGTAGIAGSPGTVIWAGTPPNSQSDWVIQKFDTDTDTIFAGSTETSNDDVVVLTYDSNDRFDVGSTAGSEPPSTYAAFERALAKGLPLDWAITGTGSRARNTFTLTTSTS